MTEVLFIVTTVFVTYWMWLFFSSEKSKNHIYENPYLNKNNQKLIITNNKKKLNFHTHYDNLKVARNAPASVIKAAYKALIQNYHPYKFEGPEQEALQMIKSIKQSYDVLIDPVSRAKHDQWIDLQAEKIKHQEIQDKYSPALQSIYSESGIPNPKRENDVVANAIQSIGMRGIGKAIQIVLVVVLTLGALVLAKGVGKELGHAVVSASRSPSIEVQLRNIASETNKNLPLMIGPDIQATSTGAAGSILVHHYNLTKMKSEVGGVVLEYYANSIAAACSNPDTNRLLAAGVTFKYEYYDVSNEFISQYTVTADNCVNK